MDLRKISPGENPPWDVNVIIEVPMHAPPVKYEFDKDAGVVVVDRFLHTAMFYPCNYGFIPHTLSGDGDPVDVLVVGNYPVIPGALMAVRPVGVLLMEDDGGQDEKILAVPCSRLHPFYDNVTSYSDLPPVLINQIAHFFEHYKDLEKNKWAKIAGWGNHIQAADLISEGLARCQQAA